ncbi:E3 ubiquitin-protein ligase arih1-like [Rhopilema esculentum]|uniref:E3 ubiquitin-protein ligase arih1-like n=1 Tax=Rhopilema esculentum TaxID=499914 RepID=UPI0031E3CAC0
MDSEDDDFFYDEDEEASDELDDDYLGDDIDSSEPAAKRSYDDDFQYECLTPESIVSTMNRSIDDVNNVFQISPATARILLTHFKWDKEKLLERYYSGDQEKLFEEAHVINPLKLRGNSTNKLTVSGSGRLNSKIDCDICLSPVLQNSMAGLECGHMFCTLCWNEYLNTKILEENIGQHIFCPATNCSILVDENFVSSVLQDIRVKSKYLKLIADSFVQSHRLMRWCPAPDCTNAVKVSYNVARTVNCLCSFSFCFGCGESTHEPVKCKWLRKWQKKCDDDSETSNWISANTKECPKCHVTIEKNGGCNHMVCRNSACKCDFCWVCLGPWDSHGSSWYNCNRYDEKEAQAARDAQAKSRAKLERYLFYCNRYMNHLQSAKFEKKLYEKIRLKMDSMQQHNMSWIEVQFLKQAVDVLCQCRNMLKYTYVFAFYLKKNNHSIIFEDNQRDLEMATEVLSEYLERDINSEEAQEIKQKVQDKYRYCEQRRKVLLDHVYEGYERDFWEYHEP